MPTDLRGPALIGLGLLLALRQREETQRATIQGLLDRIAELQQALAAMDEELATLHEQLRRAQDALDAIDREIGELEGIVADLQTRRDTLAGQLDDILGSVNSLQDLVRALIQERDRLRQQLGLTDEQLNNLTALLQAAQNQISQLQAQIGEAQRTIAALQGDIDRLNRTIADLKAESARLRQALQEADATIQALRDQVASLQADLADLRHQVELLGIVLNSVLFERDVTLALEPALQQTVQAAWSPTYRYIPGSDVAISSNDLAKREVDKEAAEATVDIGDHIAERDHSLTVTLKEGYHHAGCDCGFFVPDHDDYVYGLDAILAYDAAGKEVARAEVTGQGKDRHYSYWQQGGGVPNAHQGEQSLTLSIPAVSGERVLLKAYSKTTTGVACWYTVVTAASWSFTRYDPDNATAVGSSPSGAASAFWDRLAQGTSTPAHPELLQAALRKTVPAELAATAGLIVLPFDQRVRVTWSTEGSQSAFNAWPQMGFLLFGNNGQYWELLSWTHEYHVSVEGGSEELDLPAGVYGVMAWAGGNANRGARGRITVQVDYAGYTA